MAIAAKIGDKRTCKYCLQDYAHFGAQLRACRPCLNKYNNASIRRRSQNPKWIARRNQLRRQKKIRNQAAVNDYLKGCRCKVCRESDPRTLRAYDDTGHLTPMRELINHGHSIKSLREHLIGSQVLCFNCRAKMGNLQNNRLVAA